MTSLLENAHVLVVGFGLHGQAVAAALSSRSIPVTVVDDRPSDTALAVATELGLDISVAPAEPQLEQLFATATLFCPTPGLPETHASFRLAEAASVPTVGEFDLANQWDERPIVAITGTNGKTTVTKLVVQMLLASGRNAVEAGNTDIPLVAAIDDPDVDVFVVEASSFRLGHSSTFRPTVGTWLNFEPDHLDVHNTLQDYEDAKASIWAHQRTTDTAVANAEDPVVMARFNGPANLVSFGLTASADNNLQDGWLMVNGQALLKTEELYRALPHDISNALAASVTALAGGASVAGVQQALREFRGLPHRVELVAESQQIRWFDDSKATTPHAVVAAVGGFDSVVLLAGGKNKGISLDSLASVADRLRAVVAIGAAAEEVAGVFDGVVPLTKADSMEDAVEAAHSFAQSGDVVLLSPGCASYDWYDNYGERGDHFAQIVRSRLKDAS